MSFFGRTKRKEPQLKGKAIEIQTSGPVREKLDEIIERKIEGQFEAGLQKPEWKTDEENEVQKITLYICDASKNKGCPKTHCHIFGGPCRATSNLDCAYVEYGEKPDEYYKMVYKFVSKDEVKKIPFPSENGRTGKKRCEYCGCVADRDFGTCDHCGAPL